MRRMQRGGILSYQLFGTRLRLLTLVGIAAVALWLTSIVLATGQSALVAGYTALMFLVPLVIVGALSRSVSVRQIVTFVLWGGAVVGLALLAIGLYQVFAPDRFATPASFVVPAIEESLKLLPVVAFLWLRRRGRTWGLGATDVLLLAAAVGASVGFVEDSYIRSNHRWEGQLAFLPVTELIAQGTRVIAGHAIWTSIGGATLGLALLIRRRRLLAIVIGASGTVWAWLDHSTNNYLAGLGRAASRDALADVLRALTAHGYTSIYLFLGLVLAAIAADRFVLFRARTGAPAWPSIRNVSGALHGWTWYLFRASHGMGFVRWQLLQFAGSPADRMPAPVIRLRPSMEAYVLGKSDVLPDMTVPPPAPAPPSGT